MIEALENAGFLIVRLKVETVMQGSMKQPELMGARESERGIVLRMPMMLPAVEGAQKLADFLATYEGNKSQLILGYWDYGSEIVVTAPVN